MKIVSDRCWGGIAGVVDSMISEFIEALSAECSS
jgi:hypothetical protein